MFIDEFKVFKSFLSLRRMIENMGGDNVPFGLSTIRLSCLDCSLQEVRVS
jgi:hypothetical protein